MAGNGGIIGPVNTISVGKNVVTIATASTPSIATTQPGTTLIDYAVVAGGAVGLSFVEWLPFWLRIITMAITVIYMGAKAWNEIKKMK